MLGAAVLGGLACSERPSAGRAEQPSGAPTRPGARRLPGRHGAGRGEIWFTLARPDSGAGGRVHRSDHRDPPRRRADSGPAALHQGRAGSGGRHHASGPGSRITAARETRYLVDLRTRRPVAGAPVRSAALAVVALVRRRHRRPAQGIDGQVGRFYESEGWTVYRLGMSRPLVGPLEHHAARRLHAPCRRRGRRVRRAGLRRDRVPGAGAGPYLVAGVGAGLGSPHSQSFSSIWTLVVGGRRATSSSRRRSSRVGARGPLAGDLARPPRRVRARGRASPSISAAAASAARDARPATSARRRPPSERRAAAGRRPRSRRDPRAARRRPPRLADSVIATATEVMGRPYQYGGTGERRRRVRLLRTHPVCLWPPRHHAAAAQRRPGARGQEGRASAWRTLAARRPAHLLQPRRPGDPRRALHRRGPLHSQRDPRRAGQHAERGRSVRALVVRALGRRPANPAVGRGRTP